MARLAVLFVLVCLVAVVWTQQTDDVTEPSTDVTHEETGNRRRWRNRDDGEHRQKSKKKWKKYRNATAEEDDEIDAAGMKTLRKQWRQVKRGDNATSGETTPRCFKEWLQLHENVTLVVEQVTLAPCGRRPNRRRWRKKNRRRGNRKGTKTAQHYDDVEQDEEDNDEADEMTVEE